MTKLDLFRKSFVNAGGTFIYVMAVATFMQNSEKLFGTVALGKEFVIPIFMLMLFLISATITSFLVLGKPIMLYADGMKKEAVHLLFYTIAWLILFLLAIATILFIL